RAIEYYSCFISYSEKNRDFAERLYNDLQGNNVRCWFAPEDLKVGQTVRTGLEEAVRLHDKLLLVLSEASLNSRWVQHEVETAMQKELEWGRPVLFPVRLDDMILDKEKVSGGWAAHLRTRHIGDFRQWKEHDAYQQAFGRLLRDLKAESTGVTKT
ncbi:MAG: toll/interleukin-1 receptor domain-containing protein, partial [Chloroflexota bacterium]